MNRRQIIERALDRIKADWNSERTGEQPLPIAPDDVRTDGRYTLIQALQDARTDEYGLALHSVNHAATYLYDNMRPTPGWELPGDGRVQAIELRIEKRLAIWNKHAHHGDITSLLTIALTSVGHPA